MANKLILVPEQIYRGLTKPTIGEDIILDFSKRSLELAKRRKENPAAKNIHLNQELRRYLHLRNEQENKPVKVQIVGGPPFLVNKKKRLGIRPANQYDDDADDEYYNFDANMPSPSPSSSNNFSFNTDSASRQRHKSNSILSAANSRNVESIELPLSTVGEALEARLPSPDRAQPRQVHKRKAGDFEIENSTGKRRRISHSRSLPQNITRNRRAETKRRQTNAVEKSRQRRDENHEIIEIPHVNVNEALEARLPSPERNPPRQLQKRKESGEYDFIGKKFRTGANSSQAQRTKNNVGPSRRKKQQIERQRETNFARQRREQQAYTVIENPNHIDDALNARLETPRRIVQRAVSKRQLHAEEEDEREGSKKQKREEPQQTVLGPKSEDVIVDRLYRMLESNPQKYKIRDNVILTRRGLPVSGSDVKDTIRYLVRYAKGTSKRSRSGRVRPPPGTSYIRNYFKNDPQFHPFLSPLIKLKFSNPLALEQRRAEQQQLVGTKRGRFVPSLW